MFGEDRVWKTEAMYKWYQDKKEKGINADSHLIIPLTKPVQFTISGNGRKRNIDPYVLGALIGDGCLSESISSRGYITFTTIDEEIVQRFIAAGYDMSHSRVNHPSEAKEYRLNDRDLLDELQKLGVLGNTSKKHAIPFIYKYGPVDDRIKLMQGLMDTDGYVDDRGHMSYTTISKQLAEDVAFVVRSLGGVATIKQDEAGYRNGNGEFIQCNDAYTVYFRTKMNPDLCGLTRKKERARYDFNGGNSELGKRITDIEYIGEQESFCISVSNPQGLYVVDDFTVTHNSYLSCSWIISSCIRFPGLRAVVARKTLKSLKESVLNTIKKILRDWGLQEDVNYRINNLENYIMFWNESVILMKELAFQPSDSSYSRLGSSEYSIAAVEECNECEEKGIEVLYSRLRWMPECFKMPKMLLTSNPCMNWVRDRFVQDNDGNPAKLRKGEFYCPFTVDSNPDEEFRKTYIAALNRISDPVVRARLRYGDWNFVESNEAAAYWSFDGKVHLVDNLREKAYDPMKPIIVSLDFNVAPFMSSILIQMDYDAKCLYVLEEILGRPEEKANNTPKLADKINEKLLADRHMGGVVVTGDPAGLARSTQTEEGVNNYTIILQHLHPTFRARKKVLAKQPPQASRLEFINDVLAGKSEWTIRIDMRCRRLTEDLVYQKKNGDGTKNKSKITDPKLGIKYEKYGHLSDAFDYAVVLLLSSEWAKFNKGGGKSDLGITTINKPFYGSFEY